MNKLEIYGAVVVILILLGFGCYVKGRADEGKAKDGQYAEQLLKANQKVDTLNGQLSTISDKHNAELAQLHQNHSAELASALANVKPVILRVPGGTVQTPATPGGPVGAAGPRPPDSDLSTGIDIAPAELVFAAKYQTCRDDLAAYLQFYADLRARVNAGLPL